MSSTTARAIRGLLQFVVLLGIVLFVPAWTIRYWQAWVYLALFGGAAAFLTAYLWGHDPKLLERRVNAGPVAERETSQKWIQSLAAVGFFAEMVVPSLDHRFGWSRFPVSAVIAGDLLVVLGFFVVFLVFKENSFTSATIQVESSQRVVSTGPYAVVRHPMYAGVLIMLLGTPLALGSWWGLLVVVPMVFVLVLRVVDEERVLKRDLSGYVDYCRRVRSRLIPLVW